MHLYIKLALYLALLIDNNLRKFEQSEWAGFDILKLSLFVSSGPHHQVEFYNISPAVVIRRNRGNAYERVVQG